MHYMIKKSQKSNTFSVNVQPTYKLLAGPDVEPDGGVLAVPLLPKHQAPTHEQVVGNVVCVEVGADFMGSSETQMSSLKKQNNCLGQNKKQLCFLFHAEKNKGRQVGKSFFFFSFFFSLGYSCYY